MTEPSGSCWTLTPGSAPNRIKPAKRVKKPAAPSTSTHRLRIIPEHRLQPEVVFAAYTPTCLLIASEIVCDHFSRVADSRPSRSRRALGSVPEAQEYAATLAL